MKLNSEYGVICSKKDEKKVVAEVNLVFGRKLSKSKNPSMLEARLPFVFKHFYSGRDSARALYMEIEPNEDEKGKLQVSKRPDFGWILRTRVRDDFNHVDFIQVLEEISNGIKGLDLEIEFIKHQK